MTQEQLIYPIGTYQAETYSDELRDRWIEDIARYPMQLKDTLNGLSEEKLKTPYREGGWTIAQIVHHVADANLNGYLRCKFAYTEHEPMVLPFRQALWAVTPEVQELPVEASLGILFHLHFRWHLFFTKLSPSDFERRVIHPDYKEKISLWYLLGLYSWHPRHHAAQIAAFRELNHC